MGCGNSKSAASTGKRNEERQRPAESIHLENAISGAINDRVTAPVKSEDVIDHQNLRPSDATKHLREENENNEEECKNAALIDNDVPALVESRKHTDIKQRMEMQDSLAMSLSPSPDSKRSLLRKVDHQTLLETLNSMKHEELIELLVTSRGAKHIIDNNNILNGRNVDGTELPTVANDADTSQLDETSLPNTTSSITSIQPLRKQSRSSDVESVEVVPNVAKVDATNVSNLNASVDYGRLEKGRVSNISVDAVTKMNVEPRLEELESKPPQNIGLHPAVSSNANRSVSKLLRRKMGSASSLNTSTSTEPSKANSMPSTMTTDVENVPPRQIATTGMSTTLFTSSNLFGDTSSDEVLLPVRKTDNNENDNDNDDDNNDAIRARDREGREKESAKRQSLIRSVSAGGNGSLKIDETIDNQHLGHQSLALQPTAVREIGALPYDIDSLHYVDVKGDQRKRNEEVVHDHHLNQRGVPYARDFDMDEAYMSESDDEGEDDNTIFENKGNNVKASTQFHSSNGISKPVVLLLGSEGDMQQKQRQSQSSADDKADKADGRINNLDARSRFLEYSRLNSLSDAELEKERRSCADLVGSGLTFPTRHMLCLAIIKSKFQDGPRLAAPPSKSSSYPTSHSATYSSSSSPPSNSSSSNSSDADHRFKHSVNDGGLSFNNNSTTWQPSVEGLVERVQGMQPPMNMRSKGKDTSLKRMSMPETTTTGIGTATGTSTGKNTGTGTRQPVSYSSTLAAAAVGFHRTRLSQTSADSTMLGKLLSKKRASEHIVDSNEMRQAPPLPPHRTSLPSALPSSSSSSSPSLSSDPSSLPNFPPSHIPPMPPPPSNGDKTSQRQRVTFQDDYDYNYPPTNMQTGNMGMSFTSSANLSSSSSKNAMSSSLTPSLKPTVPMMSNTPQQTPYGVNTSAISLNNSIHHIDSIESNKGSSNEWEQAMLGAVGMEEDDDRNRRPGSMMGGGASFKGKVEPVSALKPTSLFPSPTSSSIPMGHKSLGQSQARAQSQGQSQGLSQGQGSMKSIMSQRIKDSVRMESQRPISRGKSRDVAVAVTVASTTSQRGSVRQKNEKNVRDDGMKESRLNFRKR